MNLMKYIHSDWAGQNNGFARRLGGNFSSAARTLMLLILLVAGMGSVSAQEEKQVGEPLWSDDSGPTDATIVSADVFKNRTGDDELKEGQILRIDVGANFSGDMYIANTSYTAIFDNKDKFGPTSDHYNAEKKSLDFELTSENISALKSNGLIVANEAHYKIYIIELIKDEFPGELPAGTNPIEESKDLTYEDTKAFFDFSTAIDGKSIKYARIYLISGKTNIDFSGKISNESGNGKFFADKPERGMYIYKDGAYLTAFDLKGTLNLSAKDLIGKKLVAVFKEEAPFIVGGVPTMEGELCAQYEYTFKSKQIEKTVVKYIDKSIASSAFSISDLESQMKGYSIKDIEASGNYSISWKVVDADGNTQQMKLNDNNDCWSISEDLYKDDDNDNIFEVTQATNYGWESSLSNKWVTNISRPTLSCPSGKTFADFASYNVVCEVTTEPYHVVYQFKFISIEQKSESIDIFTTEKTVDLSSAVSGETYKYVRYYLEDIHSHALSDVTKDALSIKNGVWSDKVGGYYIYKEGGLSADDMNVKISLSPGLFFENVLVAVFSDEAPAIDADGNIINEPTVKKRVEYSFTPTATEAFTFVHSKGVTGRPFVTNSDDSRIKSDSKSYMCDSGGSSACENKRLSDEGIRQGVATVEYDVYVKPNTSEWAVPYSLALPFQYYNSGGQALEPSAYIRWYDWETDKNNKTYLSVPTSTTELKELQDEDGISRGYFRLRTENANKPTDANIGVKFKATESNFGVNDVATIACDVSKYYDGIIKTGENQYYMLHEPTLSTRYIFTVRHAKVIADKIAEGKEELEKNDPKTMFSKLAEDNGRCCVSIKDVSTEFSVRSASPQLTNYYIYDNSGELVKCDMLQWKAYYEDEKGNIWEREQMSDAKDSRIQAFAVSSLNGTYKLVTDKSQSKEITAKDGDCFHLVGFIGTSNLSAPAIHYELHFLEAPAYWSDEINKDHPERKGAYLKANMDLRGELNFDKYFYDENGKLSTNPGTQETNHLKNPFDWNEAAYGFCYPQLDKYRIHIKDGNIDDIAGMSPIHGDYILLKSMNLTGVSESGKIDGSTYPYKYNWWYTADKLEDYTYRFGGEPKKYGGFLYVDASDESRTIAKIKFDAVLCEGAELCYTAVVANMTNGTEPPRLMVSLYAVDGEKPNQLVVSFLSADLLSKVEEGKWYQLYGKIAVPANIKLDNVTKYEVHIDNYATNTDGADYCVDQIMFFTSNARLKVNQDVAECNEDKVKINTYVKSDDLAQNGAARPTKLYWRIFDEDGNPVSNENKIYGDDEKLEYGTVSVPDVPENLTGVPSQDDFEKSDVQSGYFKNGSDLYLSIVHNKLGLEEGKKYYISLYTLNVDPVTGNGRWGNPNYPCDTYSPVFVPRKMYLSLIDGDGNVQTSIDVGCGAGGEKEVELKAVINVPDDDEATGFKQYDVTFDYFMGSLKEYDTYKYNGVDLKSALEDYRGRNLGDKTYATTAGLADAYKTTKAENYAVIKDAVDAGLLYLDCSKEFKHSVSVEKGTISALPIEDFVQKIIKKTDDSQEIKEIPICSPLEFTFEIDASGGGPVMELGFDGVTYPDGYKRVLRVGREQLLNMQKADGCLLHVPVNTFKTDDEATEKDGALVIVGNLELVKEGTTDPKVTANVNKVATFAADEEVSASKMYVSLNFHGADVNQQNFREGFAYKMFFQVKKKGAAAGDCEGNVEFLIKVVPEFVTWNGNADNASWNNDGNWSRSKCEELYKKDGQNTPTAAQGDVTEKGGYVDNDETLGQPDTYVPMKFTYVTLPTHNRAPWLKALSKNETTKVLDVEEGATENIQYDMMVKVENGCSHSGTGNIYDCETFYGNTCNEIYFKPEAELGNQQHLTYNKAWVEKELEANKWYLMATPLQATYAGDMYVPCANGRQETEAFQPINFKTDGGYSRTKYPIYQRSWGADAKVYTKTGDLRGESWSANLPYASVVEGKVAEWSHVYNDVQVPYSSMMGFSIRTHKKDQGKKTLIRLPKADVSYDYYEADGNQGDISDDRKTVSKESGAGRFITETTLPVSGVQNQQGYVLVGNPYMASLDMEKFFEKNENIEKGYWTYESNTATAQTSGVIRPLQAFFVKLKDGSASADIKFTPEMMTDGNTQNPDNPNNAPAIRMTAKSTGGQSVATLVADEGASVGYAEGEDVETLFDSNLNGVPMVYTVAGKQAVSINALPEVDVVPFGVSVSGDEMVEVSIEGTDAVDSPLYIYDAVSGETTEIAEGGTIDVQPNDYGRYYLTTRRSIDIGGDDVSDIVVSVRQNSVTVSAAGNIDSVNVLTLDGIRHKSYTEAGNTVKFTLQPGIYIIEAQSGMEKKSMKVYITV